MKKILQSIMLWFITITIEKGFNTVATVFVAFGVANFYTRFVRSTGDTGNINDFAGWWIALSIVSFLLSRVSFSIFFVWVGFFLLGIELYNLVVYYDQGLHEVKWWATKPIWQLKFWEQIILAGMFYFGAYLFKKKS